MRQWPSEPPHAPRPRRALPTRSWSHLPKPKDDASDEDWDAWADLQHVQALLAGWASRIGRREMAWTDVDEGYRSELRDLTSSPGLVELVGEDVAADARAVADNLFDLLATR